jgi:hypothetical protein
MVCVAQGQLKGGPGGGGAAAGASGEGEANGAGHGEEEPSAAVQEGGAEAKGPATPVPAEQAPCGKDVGADGAAADTLVDTLPNDLD